MPVGVVKSEADEAKWERAKAAAKKSGGAKNKWALVMHIFQNMKHKKKSDKKEESYEALINDLVEHLLETTGTGGIALTPGSSMGTMRWQEKPAPGLDLSLEPANIKLIPSIYPKLVPTKEVVSKENFKYDKNRGEQIVRDQYDKTAEWMAAIMQGQANAAKQELAMQKKALELTAAENNQQITFQKQKLGLDKQKAALKIKLANSLPKPPMKKK